MKKQIACLLALTLCLGLFSGCKKEDGQGEVVGDEIPYSEYNPLTGYKKDENYPEGQRPAAVMINNLYDALPQSGISSADIIYEMVTEGGITRLMAVYTDYKTMPLTGPVRSARDQFIQLMLPLNAIYVHIGSSTYADEMLNYYSYQDIDGIYLGSSAFYFDTERAKSKASEHCWYTNWEMLGAGLEKIGLSDRGSLRPVFHFADPDGARITPAGGEAKNISFRFSGYVGAVFTYDEASRQYLKSEFDIPQMDIGSSAQLGFDNLFILGTDVTFKPDDFCTDFDFSEGTGYYFTNGKYERIKWKKGDPTAPLLLTTEKGKELTVNCGKSYVAFVDYSQLENISITGAAVDLSSSEDAPVS